MPSPGKTETCFESGWKRPETDSAPWMKSIKASNFSLLQLRTI